MRILLVAYYYPPRAIIGARRPYALGKHLQRAGHEVTVLTTGLNGDAGPPVQAGAGREIRATDLLATRLNWRRRRATGLGHAQADSTWSPDPGLLGSVVMPDIQFWSWVPFALGRALIGSSRERHDVVVTTSPAESTHLVGLGLRRLTGLPWVADLRDGWRFESPRQDWPYAFQRRLDDALERRLLRGADAVVTVSEPLSADLRSRLGIAVETIPNGFDPDDVPDSRTAATDDPNGRFVLAHTGGLGHERTLEPIIAALERIRADDPSLGGRAELVVAGAQTPEEQARYAAADLGDTLRPVGMLPREEALALQRRANLLLLVTSGVRTGEATGKLFEYLAAGRPILVLGERSEAARIVEQAGAGWAIPVRDPDAAEAILRRVLAGERPPPPTGPPRESYAYPRLAERYAGLLERVAGRRSERTSRRSSSSRQSAQ